MDLNEISYKKFLKNNNNCDDYEKYGNLIQRSASPECQVARSSSALNKNLAEARAEYGLSNQKNVTMHPKLKGTWTASAIIGEPFGRCAVVPMIWSE